MNFWRCSCVFCRIYLFTNLQEFYSAICLNSNPVINAQCMSLMLIYCFKSLEFLFIKTIQIKKKLKYQNKLYEHCTYKLFALYKTNAVQGIFNSCELLNCESFCIKILYLITLTSVISNVTCVKLIIQLLSLRFFCHLF